MDGINYDFSTDKIQYWIKNIKVSFKSVAGRLFILNISIERHYTIEMGENNHNITIYEYYDMIKQNINN